jgi:CheY-like chemotaxis protein
MTKSVLDGKRVLAVDDEPDVLAVLKEEIESHCSNCVVEIATDYNDGVNLLKTKDYDLVILDIMGVRGFDLLDIATKKKLRVVMLTSHGLSPEALKRSHDMGARSYLPKDKLGQIVPFLEDALSYDFEPGWKRLYQKLYSFFDDVFGTDWEKEAGVKWKGWRIY